MGSWEVGKLGSWDIWDLGFGIWSWEWGMGNGGCGIEDWALGIGHWEVRRDPSSSLGVSLDFPVALLHALGPRCSGGPEESREKSWAGPEAEAETWLRG